MNRNAEKRSSKNRSREKERDSLHCEVATDWISLFGEVCDRSLEHFDSTRLRPHTSVSACVCVFTCVPCILSYVYDA